MQLFIQALFVITYVAGTFCQYITFDNTDVGGISLGRFYIDGTIGENVTELLLQNWQRFIFIEYKKENASTFATMCSFFISGGTCVPDPVAICQCVYNTIDNVPFVVNGTAGPDLYKAIIRARWQHQNSTNVYSDKNYTVPGPEVTTTRSTTASPTTESSSSSSRSTSSVLLGYTTSTDYQMSAEPRSCTLIFCDLYLALSLLFLELLGGAAYGIIWCIFFKKDKGKDTSLTSVPGVTVNPEATSMRELI
ncbi:hypothetical protein BsWGS_16921 [Bradybaena similaris]